MTKAVIIIYFLVTRFALFLVSLVAITFCVTFLPDLIVLVGRLIVHVVHRAHRWWDARLHHRLVHRQIESTSC